MSLGVMALAYPSTSTGSCTGGHEEELLALAAHSSLPVVSPT